MTAWCNKCYTNVVRWSIVLYSVNDGYIFNKLNKMSDFLAFPD